MTLKERFLKALNTGDLGYMENGSITITLQEFKCYFSDIKTQYISSFLPAATIEPGRVRMSDTKYLFRTGFGIYRLHHDLLSTLDYSISTETNESARKKTSYSKSSPLLSPNRKKTMANSTQHYKQTIA